MSEAINRFIESITTFLVNNLIFMGIIGFTFLVYSFFKQLINENKNELKRSNLNKFTLALYIFVFLFALLPIIAVYIILFTNLSI